MTKKKTREEYIKELSIKNPSVELIGEYNGSRVKTMHHCLIHDTYWEATPSRMLSGSGCSKCKSNKIHASNTKSHEQYVEEVRVLNPHVEVVEEYVNALTPILHKCLIHNVEWKAYPTSILHGCGCYKCGIQRSSESSKKTHERYIEELYGVNKNIVPIEKYIDATTPILHRCLIDGYEWRAKPANILFGKGCPKCAGNAKKTHEEYVSEVFNIDPNIEVVGQYSGANTPILHRCKKDGNVWNISPSDVLRGRGCPKCVASNGEKYIANWLNKHKIDYIEQKSFRDCLDKKSLPFDFYLPEYNVCIEYQGRQHYEPIDYFGGQKSFEIQQRHDKIKADYCNKNNIRLLCIPYDRDIEEELNNFLFI